MDCIDQEKRRTAERIARIRDSFVASRQRSKSIQLARAGDQADSTPFGDWDNFTNFNDFTDFSDFHDFGNDS
jgi:hypothetical protein